MKIAEENIAIRIKKVMTRKKCSSLFKRCSFLDNIFKTAEEFNLKINPKKSSIMAI